MCSAVRVETETPRGLAAASIAPISLMQILLFSMCGTQDGCGNSPRQHCLGSFSLQVRGLQSGKKTVSQESKRQAASHLSVLAPGTETHHRDPAGLHHYCPQSPESPEGGTRSQSVRAHGLFFLTMFIHCLGRENQVITAMVVLKGGRASPHLESFTFGGAFWLSQWLVLLLAMRRQSRGV